MVKDREAWHDEVHGVAVGNNWATTMRKWEIHSTKLLDTRISENVLYNVYVSFLSPFLIFLNGYKGTYCPFILTKWFPYLNNINSYSLLSVNTYNF